MTSTARTKISSLKIGVRTRMKKYPLLEEEIKIHRREGKMRMISRRAGKAQTRISTKLTRMNLKTTNSMGRSQKEMEVGRAEVTLTRKLTIWTTS